MPHDCTLTLAECIRRNHYMLWSPHCGSGRKWRRDLMVPGPRGGEPQYVVVPPPWERTVRERANLVYQMYVGENPHPVAPSPRGAPASGCRAYCGAGPTAVGVAQRGDAAAGGKAYTLWGPGYVGNSPRSAIPSPNRPRADLAPGLLQTARCKKLDFSFRLRPTHPPHRFPPRRRRQGGLLPHRRCQAGL